jgi:membrane-bound lytic murein transglycosylase B
MIPVGSRYSVDHKIAHWKVRGRQSHGAAWFVTLCLLLTPFTAVAQSADDSARFEAWKQSFAASDAARGLDPVVVRANLDLLTLDPRVIAISSTHSGFSQPMWAYLEQTVSPAMVAQARTMMLAHRDLLRSLEVRYHVEPATIVAVWGTETHFGTMRLDYNALRSLATLSFLSGRNLYTAQLVAALRLVQSGRVTREQLRSSWDGGLGQPQLMPVTFEEYAADGDGDGRIDIWNDADDALASIANFLNASGWSHGEPALIEGQVPPGFEAPPVQNRRSLAAWAALGVTRADSSGPIDTNLSDYGLLRPDASTNRTYFASQNFRTVARYNGSTRYGLAVTFLARGAEGETVAPWPRPADAQSDAEIAEAQRLLATLHYDVGDADGYYGERTWRAMNAFAADHDTGLYNYPTIQLLTALRALTTHQ